MKLSDYLNLIAATLTLLFVIFIILKDINTACFNWMDYWVSFAALFSNVIINILSALGR